MNPLLDPAAAAEVGRRHGMLATAVADGGLVVSCNKIVESGARAMIVLVPGLVRMDVKPLQDTLGVATRSLHPMPARWGRVSPGYESYKGKDPGDPRGVTRGIWRFAVELDPVPIIGSIHLAVSFDPACTAAHCSAQAVIVESADAFG